MTGAAGVSLLFPTPVHSLTNRTEARMYPPEHVFEPSNAMISDDSGERGKFPRRRSVPLSVLSLALAIGIATTAPALADLRICNRTANAIGAAIGYKSSGAWTTEGWWNIQPNTCEVVSPGALNARYYYVYAVDNVSGGEWGGKAFMCTREKQFTIKGIEDCVVRGYERTGFFEVDTGEQRNWTIQLTERPSSASPAPGAHGP